MGYNRHGRTPSVCTAASLVLCAVFACGDTRAWGGTNDAGVHPHASVSEAGWHEGGSIASNMESVHEGGGIASKESVHRAAWGGAYPEGPVGDGVRVGRLAAGEMDGAGAVHFSCSESANSYSIAHWPFRVCATPCRSVH